MLIEDLIRTGNLLKSSEFEDEKLLLLISDVEATQVRNFFQHVFVVEIPATETDEAVSLPKQVWGQEIQPEPKKSKTVFKPELRKGVATPFVFPGGNPIHPQGVYGVPVFPVFEKHLESFFAGVEGVKDFLKGRLQRCPSLQLSEQRVDQIASSLHREIEQSHPASKGKTLCLIVLADASSETSPYSFVDNKSERTIGASKLNPGKHIAPNFDIILKLYSSSKADEGMQAGFREGSCSICGSSDNGKVSSIYCKSWPWFLPTWTCPISHGGKGDIAEGIALDSKCYEALNIGACYFDKSTSQVDSIITRELFSPVADREGRRTAEHKNISDVTAIFGAILILPILESASIEQDELKEFGENLQFRLMKTETGKLQKHVKQVVGFDAAIPDGVDDSIYRLSLIFYSGDASRGDIHLRCLIEDVVPSVLLALQELATNVANSIPQLCTDVMPGSSESQHAWHARKFQFIPFILARAYGGAYVWEQLQSVLRREPLSLKRPLANIAHRISSLVANLPKTEYDIREEVLFFLAFLDFVRQYNSNLALGESEKMVMRDWKDLVAMIDESPPEEMEFENTNELGFACGSVVRQFSRQYWAVTKVGKDGKDFLKHRVVAFGSDLSPDAVWKKALPTMFNVELKLHKLRLSDDFKRRVGILLNRCEDAQNEIRSDRDGFMAAFWSGYSLQKTAEKSPPSQPEEQGATA